MQHLPGGHCFTCHKDYSEESSEHYCFKNPDRIKPTKCTEVCKDSKYQKESWMDTMLSVDN